MGWAGNLISEATRATIALRLFGLAKIPMMLYVRPSVVEISSERVVVKIPLRRRTRNHVGAMYFGALAVGADTAVGALALRLLGRRLERITPIFKDVSAEFLKRAEGDVHFCCDQGREMAKLIERAAASDERLEMPVHVVATVPALGEEPVARFKLTFSLKRQPRTRD